MTPQQTKPPLDQATENALWALRLKIERDFDALQRETAAKFRTLARSTGQRTRVDRGRP